MHIVINRVRRGNKVYEYPRLVESYRRESDGMPAHRVIAKLDGKPPQEIANLRAALEASRKGQRVVVATQPGSPAPKPTANLRYLDCTVLLELWCERQLDELLNGLLPGGEATVAPAAVVAALVVQRCVAPGSKLSATRWLPKTALPELLGIKPAQFNNTRVHRVLDALEEADAALMHRLPQLYGKRDGAFSAFFLDVTDTWFVGRGPELAERAKTKEGMMRRKVGIVLLCNEHGYPLRWKVVGGRRPDCETMTNMLQSIQGLDWVRGVPVVVDRAMGNTAQIQDMMSTGLHFVTALRKVEFPAYAAAIPHEHFAEMQPAAAEPKKSVALAAKKAQEDAGLKKYTDDLFVLDLGVVERANDAVSQIEESPDADLAVTAMRLCRTINSAVDSGQCVTYADAGRQYGLSGRLTKKYRGLSSLAEDIQLAIVNGEVAGHSLAALLRIARIRDPQEQHQAFDALRGQVPRQQHKPAPSNAPTGGQKDKAPMRVRAVVCFCAQHFVDQRLAAQRALARIDAFAAALNAKLARTRSRMKRDDIVVAVDCTLRAESLLDVYRVDIAKRKVAGGDAYHVTLSLDLAAWSRRRRYDGFWVLVAHPEVQMEAGQLVHLYRVEKDVVETDFQVIKSFVKIRPLRHRSEPKLRAHVAICMLALLLERTLRRKLPADQTAAAALEELGTCHLNRYPARRGASAYTITAADPDQEAILRRLKLQRLTDDLQVVESITPR